MENVTNTVVSAKVQLARDPESAEIPPIPRSHGNPGVDVEEWFKCWESETGEKLSNKHVKRLVKLTKNLRLQTIENAQTLIDWIEDPSAFWGFRPFHTEIELVQYCLKQVDNSEANAKKADAKKAAGIDPIRRRVSLVRLYDIVCEEKRRLKGQLHQPKSTKYLTSAIQNVVDKAYRSQDMSERAELCRICTYLQRYGKRWTLLERRESILDPFEYATEIFERVKMEPIEIEALNAYDETRCDDDYRARLKEAYKSIFPWQDTARVQTEALISEQYSSKSSRKRPRTDDQTSSSSSRRKPRNIIDAGILPSGSKIQSDIIINKTNSKTPHSGLSTPRLGLSDNQYPVHGQTNTDDSSNGNLAAEQRESCPDVSTLNTIADVDSWSNFHESMPTWPTARLFEEQTLQPKIGIFEKNNDMPAQSSSLGDVDAWSYFLAPDKQSNPALLGQRSAFDSELASNYLSHPEPGRDIDSWSDFRTTDYGSQPITLESMNYTPALYAGAASHSMMEPERDIDSWSDFRTTDYGSQPITLENMNYTPTLYTGTASHSMMEPGRDIDSWSDFRTTDYRSQPTTMENMNYTPASYAGTSSHSVMEPGRDIDSWSAFPASQQAPHNEWSASVLGSQPESLRQGMSPVYPPT